MADYVASAISLILGLGFFFLGLRLVGDNLRGLCSGGLRNSISAATGKPVTASWVGFIAGALMQSATAVTFICVSMVAAGLLSMAGAGLVIVWSNVGLTLLAFVATLNIHPAVSLLVGLSGIVMGMVRIKIWQTVAGVFLGVGLILFGLHQMGLGAEPLKNQTWFQDGIHFAVASPWLSFLAGILVAAILQSNTGATMMVITLAGAGAIPFESSALMIYGTNLGAIALRLLLASGLRGVSLQLVRLEDLFCVITGVVMGVLYAVESMGVPLVLALSGLISHTESMRLAIVFFLSNLLPALVMLPFMGLCRRLMVRMFPPPAHDPNRPQFIVDTALDDPITALDLLQKELAHLLRIAPAASQSGPDTAFHQIAAAVEVFASKIAVHPQLTAGMAEELYRDRSLLSSIRHFQDSAAHFTARLAQAPSDAGQSLKKSLDAQIERVAAAIESPDPASVARLHNETRRGSEQIEGAIKSALASDPGNIQITALKEDFVVAIWTLHHITKILRPRGAKGADAGDAEPAR